VRVLLLLHLRADLDGRVIFGESQSMSACERESRGIAGELRDS
jgi:hypothetical protein